VVGSLGGGVAVRGEAGGGGGESSVLAMGRGVNGISHTCCWVCVDTVFAFFLNFLFLCFF
jgi:hypothetical protein